MKFIFQTVSGKTIEITNVANEDAAKLINNLRSDSIIKFPNSAINMRNVESVAWMED